MTGSGAKAVGFIALAVFIALEYQLFDSPDIDIFGASLPAWLIGLVLYVLGVLAGWSAERSRSSTS